MCFNYGNNTAIKSYDPQVRHAFVVANYALIRICYSCHIIPITRIKLFWTIFISLLSCHRYSRLTESDVKITIYFSVSLKLRVCPLLSNFIVHPYMHNYNLRMSLIIDFFFESFYDKLDVWSLSCVQTLLESAHQHTNEK